MFTTELLKIRMERAHKALLEFDVDLWISVGRETHFTVEPALMFLLPASVILMCGLVISKTESVCLVGELEREEVETYGATGEVIAHNGNFEELLAAVIKRYPNTKRVALNFSNTDASADGLSYTQYHMISRALDAAGMKCEIVSSQHIMKRVRAQKSEMEVAGIEHTVKAAMGIYENSRDIIRGGMSGSDIQRYFWEQVQKLDADYSWSKISNPFVSIGARSSYLCKRPPSDVYARPGDLINVDFGLRIDGFASDNQRSYYVLEKGQTQASDEVIRAFHAVQEAERAAIAVAAPGVYTTVPRDAANEVFQRLGYPPVKGLGHELGTYAHEGGIRCGSVYPIKELDFHLEAGMTFTMEPAILTSHGRMCQEEVVAITDTGCRMLSVPQKEVWLVS